VFENRVLRRISGPKRDDVMGEWGKLHTGEIHNSYSTPDIRQTKSRRIRFTGHVAHIGEARKVYKVLVGKPKGKRPHERPKRRWEDEIRMDLRETGRGGCGVDSPGSGYELVVGSREHSEPLGSGTMEL
jgi:hypothetical protein